MDLHNDNNTDDAGKINDECPSSTIIDQYERTLPPTAPHVTPHQTSVPQDQIYKKEDEKTYDGHDTGDSDDNYLSDSSSASFQSLALNPNSSLDTLDLPGIALLKEIFPDETTASLRKLHHKHIILNKTASPAVPPPISPAAGPEPNLDIQRPSKTKTAKIRSYIIRDYEENDEMRQKNLDCRKSVAVSNLPDNDFLRLPKSVAVLRPREHSKLNEGNIVQTYEFVKDLEMRALEEYLLAGTPSSAAQQIDTGEKYVEYNTYIVDKHERLGLGMTLQEVLEEGDNLRHQKEEYLAPVPYFAIGHDVPQCTVVRYGLRVIGFLSDDKKNQNGKQLSSDSQSPAEAAGIKCQDVVLGINGSAFLLEVPISSSSYNVDRRSEQYVNQKNRIIQSMKDSPSPVVLHIRRRRERSSIEKIFSTRSANSLLDSTSMFDSEQGNIEAILSEPENSSKRLAQKFPPQNSLSALESSLPTFHTPPPIKSTSVLHPLSVALAERKLIRPGEDQRRITRRLQQFNDRARQFESSNSLRIVATRKGGGEKGSLVPHFDPNDLPPDMAALMVFPKDGVTGSANVKNLRENNIQDDEETKVLGLSLSNEHDGKNYQEVEQNHTPIPSQNSVAAVAYTPSTPSLPFHSPLIPIEYLQAFCGHEQAREIRLKSLSMARLTLENEQSPRRLFWSQQPVERVSQNQSYQNLEEDATDTIWIPLHGIRKALSARIVNAFVESVGTNSNNSNNTKSRIAYTIWVYDLESGCEWYAPIRYWEDFSNLYDAALTLLPTKSDLYKELSILKLAKDPEVPIDSSIGWNLPVFGGSSIASPMSPLQQRRKKRKNEEFDEARQRISQQLEEFLRELLGIIYICDPLHPNTAELALYVESFLGVEDSEIRSGTRTSNGISECKEDKIQKLLKRSIQRYLWRIFLLHTMKAIVKDFVDAARNRGPKFHEVESMDAVTNTSLKARAMDELLQIQRFLDELVDLILDGCNDDLRSISKRREYSPIHKLLEDESHWDRIVRESVREQVEIEVYIPLRSVISRLLVNGWRHEDMEVHYKIKELRKRPQGMFRIDKVSPSHWQSVARILKQGVGMSTLPCVKLRAIVDAAREISRLHEREHNGQELLGADEFLPVFIFCVVRAEMERPCALSILLQTLCDRINRIGEIGYFLASFEAAIAHIKEIDLTEDQEEMLSFLTVPLTEVPLDE